MSCPFPIDSTLSDIWWKRCHPLVQMQMRQAKLAKQIMDRGGPSSILGLGGFPLGSRLLLDNITNYPKAQSFHERWLA